MLTGHRPVVIAVEAAPQQHDCVPAEDGLDLHSTGHVADRTLWRDPEGECRMALRHGVLRSRRSRLLPASRDYGSASADVQRGT